MGGWARGGIVLLILVISVATSGVAALQDMEADADDITGGAGEFVKHQIQMSRSQTQTGSISLLTEKFECGESEELLAKYEIEDTDGDGNQDEFVFEKGSVGDVFEFTSVSLTDDGGVRNFTWESTTPLVVRAHSKDDGPTTDDWEETFDPPTRGPIDVPDADKAYSNVQFCGEPVFQIDLVEGEPADPLEEEDLYRPQNRLIRSAFGSEAGNILERGGQNSPASDCVDISDPIDVAYPDKNASITFVLTDADGCLGTTISFAGYDLPGDERGFSLPQQLTDSTSITIGNDGVEPGDEITMEISLEM